MDIVTVLDSVKKHPDFGKAGMLLCHNGVVRETSRDGRKISGLTVKVDHKRLADVIREQSGRKGIVDVRVVIAEDRFLNVGEDIMLIAVAGDVRENVIQVLSDTLNAVKSSVTTKTEVFV